MKIKVDSGDEKSAVQTTNLETEDGTYTDTFQTPGKPRSRQVDVVASLDDAPAPSQHWYRRLRTRKFIIPAVAVAVVLVAGITAFALNRPDGTVADQQADTPAAAGKKQLLGAELAVADGVVEVSDDEKEWEDIAAGDVVKQGQYLRSAVSARAVVNLDDGSSVRIGDATTIRLTKLDPKDVVIANVAGEVYTRVVASDRKFNVTVNDERYRALGTAYKTVNTDTTKGLEVYHSKVKALASGKEVAEGSRYYQQNPTANLAKAVTAIPLDQLQKDEFLQWNLQLDKQNDDFKDKLGYLAQLEKTPAAKPPAAPAGPSAGIVLGGSKFSSGISLNWKVTGLTASKGFKLVRGLSANPTYGEDEAVFLDAAVRNYSWKIKDGKTYHFRVCIYTGDGCTNYSNNFSATAPLVASEQPSGSLTLKSEGGKNVSWVLNGSAPDGYKLVWSKDSSTPSYPGDNPIYYGAGDTSGSIGASSGGTYYARVCMYTGDGCINYSNTVTLDVD